MSADTGEKCRDCKRPYKDVWRATDTAWRTIIGPDTGGTYCPKCFLVRCVKAGHSPHVTIELDDFTATPDDDAFGERADLLAAAVTTERELETCRRRLAGEQKRVNTQARSIGHYQEIEVERDALVTRLAAARQAAVAVKEARRMLHDSFGSDRPQARHNINVAVADLLAILAEEPTPPNPL